MANSVQITASMKVSANGVTPQLNKQISLAQVGTQFNCESATVGTAAATLTWGACANLGYVQLYNPDDSTKTITVSVDPIVLIPGRVAIFPPSTMKITCQATAVSAALNKIGAEA